MVEHVGRKERTSREPQENLKRTSRALHRPHLAAVDEHNQALSELPRQRLPGVLQRFERPTYIGFYGRLGGV